MPPMYPPVSSFWFRLPALLALLLLLGSCASPTRYLVQPPEDIPPTAAQIILSRSLASPGGFRTMKVLGSSMPLAKGGSAAAAPVQYCSVQGRPAMPSGVKVTYLQMQADEKIDCVVEVNTAIRLPMVDQDKAIDIDTVPFWSPRSFGGEAHKLGVRLQCVTPTAAGTARPFNGTAFARVRRHEAVLDSSLARSCVEGVEIGDLGPGGELRWLVNPGPLTVAIFSHHTDGVWPWLTRATFDVKAGQTLRLQWRAPPIRENRLMLDGSIAVND
jgi:hypothetical protein